MGKEALLWVVKGCRAWCRGQRRCWGCGWGPRWDSQTSQRAAFPGGEKVGGSACDPVVVWPHLLRVLPPLGASGSWTSPEPLWAYSGHGHLGVGLGIWPGECICQQHIPSCLFSLLHLGLLPASPPSAGQWEGGMFQGDGPTLLMSHRKCSLYTLVNRPSHHHFSRSL